MEPVELELPQPFVTLSHTADTGVEVRGASAAEALARLVLAYAQLVAGDGAVERVVERELTVAGGGGFAVLAVDVVRAAHALWVLERLVPATVAVVDLDEAQARLHLGLGPYSAERHGEGLDVKAITYHAACLAPEPDGSWVARVIVDI
jgi:SHS2 domain-containing protein